MSDTVIRVENLSKRYQIGLREKQAKTLRQALQGMVSSPFKYLNSVMREPAPEEIFWALQDISFEVKRGQVVGIIGRNGAGKSTLLKILSQITEPTSGYAEIRGRVGSLLEVGTGFHPDLTGRENTYLNGTIMGMRKREIDRRFDEIVAFAEVEKFIDTPVKHYSSGMYTRLAFAVAAHLEPEILIVDEVLAVGDSQFQKKCLGKMEDVSQEGRSILLVSHNMSVVSNLCQTGILLEGGLVKHSGNIQSCIQVYVDSYRGKSGRILDRQTGENQMFQVADIRVNGIPDDFLHLTSIDKPLKLEVSLFVNNPCKASIEVRLKDCQGQTLGLCSPGHMDSDLNIHYLSAGSCLLQAEIYLPKLNKGRYLLDIIITEPEITCYVGFPFGLEIEFDGIPTKTGHIINQGSKNGFQILEGSVILKSSLELIG